MYRNCADPYSRQEGTSAPLTPITPNRRSLCRIVRYLFLFVGVLGPFKCHTLVL